MLSLGAALREMLAAALPAPAVERRSLAGALGATLAVDVVAAHSVPPFDNSAMDGFALRAADADGVRPLPVSQQIRAGEGSTPLAAGCS